MRRIDGDGDGSNRRQRILQRRHGELSGVDVALDGRIRSALTSLAVTILHQVRLTHREKKRGKDIRAVSSKAMQGCDVSAQCVRLQLTP